MNTLTAASRDRSMTADEQRDFDAASAQVADLDRQIATAERELEVQAGQSITRTNAAEIARICVAGGQPGLIAGLLAEGASVEAATARFGMAAEAAMIVASARRKDPSIPEDFAATQLSEGKSLDQIRSALLDKLVTAEERQPTSSHIPATPPAGPATATSSMERELKRVGVKKDS
jgi:hypothetical protein